MSALRRAAAPLLLAALLYPGSAAAQNAIALSPDVQGVELPAQAQLSLQIDFSDPAIGGGIVIGFDESKLAFSSFSFDPAFPDDPSLRLVCPSATPACDDFAGPGVLVAFAVDTLSEPAIQGAHTVGTLTLDSLAPGLVTVTTAEDDSVAGPIVGTGSFAPPTLGTATVAVGTSAPSVPALTSAGVLGLAASLTVSAWVGIRRRRRMRG